MEWKKTGWFSLVAIIVGLYTTFVLQSLWNWFVVTAFNIPSVSYWQMYGLVLLVTLISERSPEIAEEQRWKMIF